MIILTVLALDDVIQRHAYEDIIHSSNLTVYFKPVTSLNHRLDITWRINSESQITLDSAHLI
jgi:hypothetical protein